MIKGLSILLFFQCLGELIRSYTQVALPGPVIGMLLLFAALCLRGGVAKSLQNASQSLIGLMTLLFVPATTGLFFLSAQIMSQWLAIAVSLVAGTVLSLIFNALLMKRLVKMHE
ncbi:CidA/LrgA family protein [Dasania sp. GY-MA-18]|uniref:CidA/LrgA family protein n=1 Tax=Dasania phycosphaerae TaxID=2950436 RepID=A0A9J6RKY1_9GAMM|nr:MULTISPECIES: CidA/LrgA family protein [Dasania]MCR8922225.1 CidA/LrgA family protein [Dasania sp. GY-MA-18]MCZ0864653.1 CidA/LrgA family protein [Dasania phycosphaerae]MCZ0868381.1 CidA/LrgA family protein [Dasania phycosphaerae]